MRGFPRVGLKNKFSNPIQDTPKPNDGPVPMEIDRVEKGQWKGKGKGKDKGKGQYVAGNLVSGALAVDVDVEEMVKEKERKEKGKDKGKGKGKSKNNKGKGQSKGKLQPNQCSLCRGFGHWRSNCPHQNKPMEVNQVQASYNPTQQQRFPPPPPVQQVPFPGQSSQQSGNPVYQAPVGTAATTASSLLQHQQDLQFDEFFILDHHHLPHHLRTLR